MRASLSTIATIGSIVLSGFLANTSHAKSIDVTLQEYDDYFAKADKDWRMKVWSIQGKHTQANMTEGEAKHSPWSGSSWSFNRGGTALRYKNADWRAIAGRDFTSKSHEKLHNLFTAEPPVLLAEVSKDVAISPVEKYDMLLDDEFFGLTYKTWDKLFSDFADYEKTVGKVPDYFGYCDGWAISSSTHKKPVKPVTLTSVNGRKVTFDVPDIRALTAMYHQLNPNLRYQQLATRCIRGYQCDKVHPGLFHIALLDRIGKNKKPLLYDSAQTSAVWNKVIKGFSLEYFNPHNDVNTDKKGKDIFKYRNNYLRPGFERDPKAEYAVGVKMVLDVVRLRTQYDLVDAIDKYTYYYELELDANNNIVGGEWLYKMGAEPDFVWFVEDVDVFDVVEADGSQVPASIRRKALYDTHTYGYVNPWIIKQLIEQSAQ